MPNYARWPCHSGGTATIQAGAVGAFDVGVFTGSSGTYNLSGTGQLISNKSEYVGDLGSGSFFQTGGSNTITGANSLILGNNAGGQGTYAISGGTLTVGKNIVVGNKGIADLNISGTGVVNVANGVSVSNSTNLNLFGGTLRLNTLTGLSRVNYGSGTLQLAGNRNLGTDAITNHFFGTNLTVGAGKRLVIEGDANLFSGSATINGGGFTSLGTLRVGYNDSSQSTFTITQGAIVTTRDAVIARNDTDGNTLVPGVVNVSGAGSTWSSGDLMIGRNGRGALNITGGGSVDSASVTMGFSNIGSDSSYDTLVVSGSGSTLNSSSDLRVGYNDEASVTIENGGTVSVVDELYLGFQARVTIDGGTLRFNISAVSRMAIRTPPGSSPTRPVRFSSAGIATLAPIQFYRSCTASLL